MRSFSRRERVLGAATLAMIAGAVLFWFVFEPQWSRYTRLQDEVVEMELGLTRMQANMRLKDRIEARYDELKGLIRESGSPSQEMSRFARLLNELYRPLDIQTRSVRPLPDEDEGFYRKFSLQVEMVGSIAELARFLTAVAQADDPIRVERVDLVCKDRPDHVTASLIVTKVVTESEPGGAGRVVKGRFTDGAKRSHGGSL